MKIVNDYSRVPLKEQGTGDVDHWPCSSHRINAQRRVTLWSDPPLEGIGASGVESGISGIVGGVSCHPTGMLRRVALTVTRYVGSNSHNRCQADNHYNRNWTELDDSRCMSFVGNSLQRNRGLRDSTAAFSSVLLAAQVLNNSHSDLFRILIVHGGLHIAPTGEISSHRRSLHAQHLR